MFFYLLSVVPAIWFLELHEIDTRIELRDQTDSINSTNFTLPVTIAKNDTDTKESLNLNIEGLGVGA